jgi:AraC-like DNA-binding protein
VNDAAPSWITERFQTRDADVLLEHLNRDTGASIRKIMPLGRTADFHMSRNEMDLGRIRLAQSLTSSVRMDFPGPKSNCQTVIVSERGQSLINNGRSELVTKRGDAAIMIGAGEGFFQSSAGDKRFVLQIDQSNLLEQFQGSGWTKRNSRETWARVDLSTLVGRNFHRALHFIWQQRAPPNELLRAAYDEILLQGLVSLFGPVLSAGEGATLLDPGSAYVQRASELIRARVGEPIRIAEIARDLGISPRHLQSGFRRYLGVTPHQFLRDCRLEQVHRMLSAGLPGLTATTIAYDCGFGHLGEFARAYRNRFGEAPSETLRRAKSLS